MTEPTTPTPDAPEGDDTPPEGEAKTFDEAYVKKLRDEAAKYRTEAKANADAATKLAAIEAANKTDAEKTAEALAAAQRDIDQARLDALRFRIASKHGVSDEDAELFLTGTDEETLTKQAERLTALEAERQKNGNHVAHEGRTPPADGGSDRDAVRGLFGGSPA